MVIAFIMLIFIILVHEFGHFLMGKLLHVPVYEFSIGMGPKICSWQGKKETKYSLRWLPIGGFCSFDKGDVTGIRDSALYKLPIWKRAIILFGGAGFNFLSAFLVAIAVCWFIGMPQTSTTIYDIADERADSFFMAGDTIVGVDGYEITDYPQLAEILGASDGEVNITVMRDGQQVSSDVKLFEYDDTWKMGTTMQVEYKTVPARYILQTSSSYCWTTGASVLNSLLGLAKGDVSVNDMSGIVGIVKVVGDAAKENLRSVFNYFIMLSINIGILNLMPIPGLDGSKLLLCFVEAVFKKVPSEKTEERVTITFAMLLMMFMVYLIAHDIFMLTR